MPDDQKQKTPLFIPICAIGASAGGITSLRELFRHLPDNLGIAYVVIMHLAPDHPSVLSEILAAATRMPVRQVDDGIGLQPDCIYVIPPDRELVVEGDNIKARPFTEPRGRRAPIDMFFRSVARGRGDGMAVVLSGAGSDGALGVSAIKEGGGVVFVQEPADAEYPMMPRSALSAGVADFVAPIPRLVERIVQVARSKEAVRSLSDDTLDHDLRRIVSFLRARTGHDFSSYKRATVMRRVLRRVQVARRSNLADYAEYLATTAEEAKELFSDLLISVTMFFRDNGAYQAFAEKVVKPAFDQSGDHGLRAWVVGCASGEEAYSVAIVCLEEMERRGISVPLQIFATDLDDGTLGTAREGRYPKAIEADVSDERLRRYFVKEGAHYRIKKEVRDVVLFATHSVLKEPPFMRLDIITCRNLLIYLERNLQRQVCALFHYGLRSGGYLFLGSAETIDTSPEMFYPVDREARLYSARAQAPRTLPIARQLSGDYMSGLPPFARLTPKADRDRDLGATHVEQLERQAPPSVLVDRDGSVLHLSPSVGRFFQPSAGPIGSDVVSLIKSELRLDLVSALRRAFEQGQPVLCLPVTAKFEQTQRRVLMQVVPSTEQQQPSQALVFFMDAGEVTGDDVAPSGGDPSDETKRLRDALRASEHHLTAARREHEDVIQDLRIANEELQSINEEYRSTSEELETSKEELQSMNEELQTINGELKSKLQSISSAHNDLQNLISTTQVGTLFLDAELRIRMFTPAVADLFNVTDADIGRIITDFTHRLAYNGLHADAVGVMRNLLPSEREVSTRDDRWMIMRVRPYRTVDDRIDGVVVTFVDVTELRQTTSELRASEMRFRALVQAYDDAIYSMGPDWKEMRYLQGRGFLPDTTNPSADWILAYIHPDERDGVQERIRQAVDSKGLFQLEHRVKSPDGSFRWILSRAVPLLDDEGRISEWFGASTDITERRLAEEQLRQTRNYLGLANAASHLGWGVWQFPNGLVEWDSRAREIIGLDEAQNAVQNWLERIHADDRPNIIKLMEESRESGRPFDFQYRVVHPNGQIRHVHNTGMFLEAKDGQSGRGTGLVRDITEQNSLEETQQLLMAELSHRVKNMLAIVQSVAHQTGRTSSTMEDFVGRFGERMRALGRAHSLLTDSNWQGTTLDAIAYGAVPMVQHDGDASNFTAQGPKVVLSAGVTVSLTMAFHELGTNALKYGALSVDGGSIALKWQTERLNGVESLRIRWVEQGGPLVSAPSRKGFGSRLLELGLAHETDGKVVLDYRPEGVVCTIDVPLGQKIQLA